MFLAKLSVKRPKLIAMFLLVFIIFGAMAYFDLPLTLLPKMDMPIVTVQTIYPGAGPVEVEQQITIFIEDAVSTVSGIDYIESYSMDNVSIVTIAFDMSVDVNIASQQVRDKVTAIVNNLPRDAMTPIVGTFDMNATPVAWLLLSGTQSPMELYQYANTVLTDVFSQIQGVAQVNVSGNQEREIQVILDPQAAHANNVSLPMISQIIATNNINLPAGTFSVGGTVLSVRVVGELADINTLKNLSVPTPNGNRRLSDLATIVDTGTEITERTVFLDKIAEERHTNVIVIEILPSSNGNSVQISKAMHRQLNNIKSVLPVGMELTVIRDSSEFVEGSINDTMSDIFLGILLTGLLLFIFLGDLRSTLIVALAMPMSIISTFMLMQFFGFSLNVLSLLGLATSIGVLVTSSIVVLENIYRYKAMGHDKKSSAEKGTSEIVVAVLASVLTNLVVFIPIGTMGGMAGQLFVEFGLTVVFATIFSLLISFTLTPMLASIILPENIKSTKMSSVVDKMMKGLEKVYLGTLNFVVKTKGKSMAILGGTVLLFIFSLFLFTRIGFEFMPAMDQGELNIRVEFPVGQHLDETATMMQRIENIIAQYPEIEYIITNLGKMGGMNTGMHLASMDIKVVDHAERQYTAQQIADRMIRDLAFIPNAKIRVAAESSAGGGGRDPISLRVSGLTNEGLNDLAYEIMENIRDIPGLINLDTSVRPGRPELVISPIREQLALTGVSVSEIAIGARASVEGLVASQFKEDGNEYDIRVTADEIAYASPDRFRSLSLMTSRGRFQLSQLVEVDIVEGVNQITRRNKSRAIEITGSPATGYPLGDITSEIDKRLAEIEIPVGYNVRWGGSAESMNESVVEMGKAFIIAILLLYMLLTAILESFKQPILIMSSIPFALTGVFLILYITGLSMNLMSMMAIIMLIGIVINNSILILDFANMKVREEGLPMKEALLLACSVKLRAILMTNIAMIFAMLPMALGMGEAGKEFRQSMGIVSIGGLLMSTFLSLYVTPALSYVTTKTKKMAKAKI
ncbi:MAG: efflux RND transporter permease subunit [Candidatus Cloacimonetes bacterium]|nr:efflux RND transporter permease subunit [Candidatus Cloacimonadota bacterium]